MRPLRQLLLRRGGRPRAATLAPVIVALAAMGLVGWFGGYIPAAGKATARWMEASAADVGFSVGHITLRGYENASRDELIGALDVKIGDPIFGVDLSAARARLEALDWVDQAGVARLLPDRLDIEISERRVLAIWQLNRRHVLVDVHGDPIPGVAVESFAHLPVVVGPEASRHAAALLSALEEAPVLRDRLRAAGWIGGRRWTLHLDDSMVIHLPEEKPAEAIAELMRLDGEYGILSHEVDVIDMRLPDRIAVRPAAGANAPADASPDSEKGGDT